ncbi:nucleotide exchange factor GrpE [Candidatus Mycalebacterium sp.]
MTSKKKEKPEEIPENDAEQKSAASAKQEEKKESGAGKTENFEDKYNELNDRFLRLAADFDNYKKHTEKEKETARLSGVRDLAASTFSILDSLELALKHGSQSGADSDGLIQGVRLTYEQSVSQLGNFGITQLSVKIGEKFNPSVHQAIENRPSEEVENGCVAEEIAKGYIAGETLIRPIFVAVSSGKAVSESPASENKGQSGEDEKPEE